MTNFKEIIDLKKKYLVTGAAGFIGSNIVETLLNNNAYVIAIDNFASGTKNNLKPFVGNPNFEFIEMDITNYEKCLFATEKVDYVLHQAGLGSVPKSLTDPLIYYKNNIIGTLNMLQASKENGVSRFIYASSSSVYGDSEKEVKLVGEEGYMLSPYAMTKYTCEEYANFYTRVFGLETIGLRYFNVYGKNQDPNSMYAAVVPKFIKSMKEGNDIYIYGDGEQVRDFVHVSDVVSANLKACTAHNDAVGQVYNIANGKPTTINELFYKIKDILHYEINPIYMDERVGDIKYSCADISEAKKYLNYDPAVLIDNGLMMTVEYFLGVD